MTTVQGAVGWSVLTMVLASALPLGANRPLAWLALSAVVAILLAAQLLIDAATTKSARADQLQALLPVGMLYLFALAWAAAQGVHGAGHWAHPAWTHVTDPAALRTISADPLAGWLTLPRLAAYAAIFWIVAQAAMDPVRARRMGQAIALTTTGMALFGLIAAGTGVNPILDLDGGRRVVSASFVNRNSYATWAAFGALANLAAFVANGEDRRRAASDARQLLRDALERFFSGGWLFALGFVISVTALIATQSRAGVLSGLVGLVVFGLAWRRREAGGGATLSATVLLVVFSAAVAGSGLASRLLSATGEEARFLVYPLVVEGIVARPWLGHGLGAFEDVFRAYLTPELATGEWRMAHNSYLEIAFELGLPAALALISAIGLLTLRVRKGVRERRRDRAWPSLALGCVAVAATHSLFDFSLQIPAVAALFAAILGLGWAQSFRRSRGPDSQSAVRNARPSSSRTAVSRPE